MKKSGVLIPGLVFSLVMTLLTGCGAGANPKEENDGKISVYTSFYVLYDFAKKIGGDRIELTNLVPAGTEPHEWEPSPSDIASLEKADVLVYNGAGMEGWLDRIRQTLKNKKLIEVETSREIKLLENTDRDEGLEYDPHVWLNPLNAKKQMEEIAKAFSAADPANKAYYENNYNENAKKLDDLDKEFRDTLEKYTNRDIVVAHRAFGYLCGAYGLEQVAIEGLNADAEPSPAKMAEITTFVKENNIKYIFFEELISPRVAEAIAGETGAKTEALNPLEGLGEKDMEAGKEYFSVMRENLEAISKALE